MNKEQLRSILSDKYDLASWRQVLTEVFGATGLFQQPKPITLPANDLAESSSELGSFNTGDGRVVGLYQVDLTDKPRIWQNRVGLRTLLRNVYQHDVDAALVVFVQSDKWRLSLISEIRVLDAAGNLTEQKTEPKRFTYLLGKGETIRTPVDRLGLYSDSARNLKDLIDAFSVEPLNKAFFKEYRENVFEKIVNEVKGQFQDAENARLFTQRLLNRLMFLYFIQKKGWMKYGGSEDYLWHIFDDSIRKNENFYRDRLYYVFFYGLSNQAESKEIHDSAELEVLRGHVPYLNGGLFEQEPDGTDEKGKIIISNDRFSDILTLFGNYNFTIDESTPFEVQVAVDPEMLGKVFEELVTGRHSSGSYYTPRTVVSFMCREALKHALAECDTPEAISRLVDESDGKDVKNPEKILDRLRGLRACDPACGSGAYLLGMLQELLHVREALFAATAIAKDAQYNWKREIIENNIYGVDLDRFATQIAALRLWLSLAIESDEPHPLPNLKYKIGCGDSLLAPIETTGQADLHRRALIEQFRARKAEYTDAEDHLQKAEAETEIERLRVEIARTLQHLPEPPSEARLMLAKNSVTEIEAKLRAALDRGDKYKAEEHQRNLTKLKAEIADMEAAATVQHYDTGNIFDWSVEFAEVFEDGGFDIVLANPPYVRQEEIDKDVKKKLLELYAEAMTGKSDLFVAFYARGLQVLRDGGTHVFVCSNSWLDVGYGGKLQGYLLNNSHVAAIYDSAIERQFASADINTIISFIHKQEPDDDDVTRFVSLRAPFLEALADETKRRVVTKTSAEIWESGANEHNRYEGDKWGGKYLRAADIYYSVIEKGADQIHQLSEYFDGERYLNTGGADGFFILTDVTEMPNGNYWVENAAVLEDGTEIFSGEIERAFLRPLIKNYTRQNKSIEIGGFDAYCLVINENPSRLLNRYIHWGETQGYDQRSVTRLQNPWYRPTIQMQNGVEILAPRSFGETFVVYSNPARHLSLRFYRLHHKYPNSQQLVGYLNSTLYILFLETLGNKSLGQGVLDFFMADFLRMKIPVVLNSSVECAYERMKNRDIKPIFQEISEPDRRELDNIIFDALGLTQGERDAVYEAVIDLVSKRLQRAQTITG